MDSSRLGFYFRDIEEGDAQPNTNECPKCGDMRQDPREPYCCGRRCGWLPRKRRERDED
jgi:hypothetical protein